MDEAFAYDGRQKKRGEVAWSTCVDNRATRIGSPIHVSGLLHGFEIPSISSVPKKGMDTFQIWALPIKFSGAKATVRTIRTKAIKYHGGVKDERGGSTRMNRIYFRQLHNKI